MSSTDPAADRARLHYDLIDAGQIDRMVELFTEDMTYHRPGYETMRGAGELARFYRIDRRIERGRHRIDLVVVNDGEVVVRGDFEGVLKDGAEIRLRFADFFGTVADGRFSRRETFFFAPLT
ncbi:nuclear transport factor 2 family protein [Salinispora arenicola]|uniref:nuclear transport factor 2 family protein n=1 Tax=Salinispora arenicola TaxID=168697 RepID=UPI00035EC4C0|nr:nuclear transport factor 2 family protein [Salinispora arenicola]